MRELTEQQIEWLCANSKPFAEMYKRRLDADKAAEESNRLAMGEKEAA